MAHKRRFHHMRARGAAFGRSLATGIKGTAVGGASGAATFFVHDFAQKNVEFLGKTPWVAPLILLGVGHVMKTRASMAGPGMAVCGASGYALGNALSFMFATKKAATQQAEATKGLEEQETGALLEAGAPEGFYQQNGMSDDVGALITPRSSAATLGM